MAFIYEVNGQRVEFEKEPTEKDIDDAAKSLRPAAESRQPRPVEGQGGAAFGVYRPQGRRPESQQDREASKEMPIQTARGVVTGALGGPSDLLNLPGNLYGMATGQPSPYQVPFGSEQFNEMLPFKSDTPQAKLARFGGEVMAPFPSVKAIKAIPGAVRGVGDIASGAYGAATGKIADPGVIAQPWQTRSVRQPVSDSFYTPEDLAKWRSGEVATGAIQPQPIQNLGPEAMKALQQTQGNVPFAGQGMRAFGESLGQTYRNPLNLLTDIGLDVLTSGGLPTAARLGYKGYEGYKGVKAANTLEKAGFSPMYPEEMAALKSGAPHPSDITGPIAPPQSMAAPTPAANAAMATTQRVAKTPAAPRPQPQPFTLPDAGQHYAMAEQGNANFADTFNKAVSARTQDLLKNAKQTGQPMTAEQAGNLAYDEIKEWRKNNVEAFKPAPQTGPVEPAITPEQLKQELNPVKVDPELASDQRIWKMLQDKTAAGTKLVANEETAVKRITNKYGQDPFQTGDLKGSSVLEAADVADGFQVRASMKDATKGGITSKNGQISIDQALFNETAKSLGMPEIDFKSMPDLKGMSVAEARKAVATEINRQYKAADAYGKTTRGPTQATLVKQAEAERTATMTPEQIVAQDAAAVARMNKLNEFLKTGKTGTGTAKPTTEVAGPVRPEGAVDAPKMTNAELLELIKARSKSKAPPDVMNMTTGNTTHANITDAAGDLMVKQMTNNTGMFETTYNKGKDIVFEKKYPGYHSVEIVHPDGTETVYKKHEIAGSTEYSRNTIDKNGVYSQFEQSRSKPKGWFSVEDEIGKGK